MLKVRHRLDGCLYAVKRIKKPITGHLKLMTMLREVFGLAAVNQVAVLLI